MTKKDCTECENEALQNYANLYSEYQQLRRYAKFLEKGLDIELEINRLLRNRNFELENKLNSVRIYTGE